MATNTSLLVPLVTSSLINLSASQSDDMYMYNNRYLPYYSAPYYILMTLSIMYIPFITVPSLIVIATTIMIKNHHTVHLIFLSAVSATDLLIALVIIPFRLLIDLAVTKEAIRSDQYRDLCFNLNTISGIVQNANLIFLTILGFDVAIRITFPIIYWTHASIKKAFACLATTVTPMVCFIVSFHLMQYFANCDCPFSAANWNERAYPKVIGIIKGTLLFNCFATGIYVRYKIWKLKIKAGRLTSLLLMLYIIFYIPSLIALLGVVKFDKAATELWWHIARQILYLSPLTNGLLIPFYRPAYKFAFKYFLSTNPMHWHELENKINESVYSSRKLTIVDTTNRNVSLPHSPTGSKIDQRLSNRSSNTVNLMSRDTSTSGRSVSFAAFNNDELSRNSVKSGTHSPNRDI